VTVVDNNSATKKCEGWQMTVGDSGGLQGSAGDGGDSGGLSVNTGDVNKRLETVGKGGSAWTIMIPESNINLPSVLDNCGV